MSSTVGPRPPDDKRWFATLEAEHLCTIPEAHARGGLWRRGIEPVVVREVLDTAAALHRR